jgi:hypothetical protein
MEILQFFKKRKLPQSKITSAFPCPQYEEIRIFKKIYAPRMTLDFEAFISKRPR